MLAESSDIVATVKQTLKGLTKEFGIDSQIEIVMLETLFISVLMSLITLCEFCKLNRYMALDYNEIE
jgi:hypothetical protein